MRGRWMLAVLLASACGTTNTGNPIEDMTKNNTGDHEQGTAAGVLGIPAQCEAVEEKLGGLDSMSELGITPNDVLAFAGGEHKTKIRWSSGGIATYEPETGEHALTIHVAATGTKPRAVSYRMRAEDTTNNTGKGLIDIGQAVQADCSSFHALEVDVTVEVASDGGALNEKLSGTLVASSALWAETSFNLDGVKLGGGFRLVSTNPPGFKLKQLTLGLGFSPLGVRGSLTGILEMTSTTGASSGSGVATNGGASTGTAAANGAIATIGDDSSCDANGGLPIAVDRKLGVFSAENALDALGAIGTVRGTFGDGSHAGFEFGFERDGNAICAVLEASYFPEPLAAGSLLLGGTLHVKSDDGRLDVRLPVTMMANPGADGGLHDIGFGIANSGGPIDKAVLESYGLAGLDVSSYDSVSVAFKLVLQPSSSSTPALGMFQVSGLTFAPCAKEPTPSPDPNAKPGSPGGTPGCAGADFHELVSVSW